MSEFRKYRLISKLLEIHNVSEAPQKYVSMINEHSGQRRHFATEPDVDSLSAQSQDPAKFVELVHSLRNHDETMAMRFLNFLQNFVERKRHNTRPIMSNPWDMASFASSKPLETLSSPFNGNIAVEDPLEQVGCKLERAQHRLGLIDHKAPNHLPTSTSMTSPSQLRISPFENDFEWIAGKFPTAIQELLVMEDLLYLLLGLSGRMITRDRNDDNNYFVDATLSPSLLQTALPFIHAANSFGRIESFIAMSTSMGRVNQALCASLIDLMQEFRQVIVSLERRFATGTLGLQQFCFHLSPYCRNLESIAECLDEVLQAKASGGATLILLEKKVNLFSGDKALKNLFESLLIKSAVPFLDILRGWLENGRLEDPFNEFMIRPRHDKDAPLYGKEAHALTSGYIVLPQNTPSILASSVNKILEVGVFHNILNGYTKGEDRTCPDALEPSLFVFDQRRLLSTIDRSFSKVNRRMLDELLSGDRFLNMLRTCKRYFFLQDCTLTASFLDFNRQELEKPWSAVIKEHVVAGWEMAKETGKMSSEDSNRLVCSFAELPLFTHLLRIVGQQQDSHQSVEGHVTGVDHFAISIKVDFPETLIFNSDTMAKYEMLFRLFFKIQHLTQELSRPFKQLDNGKVIAFLKRQMRVFLVNLHQYLCFDVIEPNWNQLMEAIPSASGMDVIIQVHTRFIDSCVRQAMFSNAKLLALLAKLFGHCSRLQQLLNASSMSADLPAKGMMLQKLFGDDMKKFLESLEYFSSRDYDYHLGSLFTRLEYNSYYYSTSFASDGTTTAISSMEHTGSINGHRPSLLLGGMAQ